MERARFGPPQQSVLSDKLAMVCQSSQAMLSKTLTLARLSARLYRPCQVLRGPMQTRSPLRMIQVRVPLHAWGPPRLIRVRGPMQTRGPLRVRLHCMRVLTRPLVRPLRPAKRCPLSHVIRARSPMQMTQMRCPLPTRGPPHPARRSCTTWTIRVHATNKVVSVTNRNHARQ